VRATTDVTDVRLEQLDRTDWVAVLGDQWDSAEKVLDHLERNSHHVDAVRALPWKRVLSAHSTVLDLACGSGWVTGILSARPDVERVIAWDASPGQLRDMVPRSVELVGGDIAKVETVCGLFTPLTLEDSSIDCAVLASAFHHADQPDELLSELIRVVRPRGTIVLANEVPHPPLNMLRWIATSAAAATVNSLSARLHLDKPGHVAADHILYDDELGDRSMTMAQWRRLFARHPISVEVVDSGLVPYRPAFRAPGRGQRNLTHFVLRPR
jgi:SAM-dependent methyltransferase